MSNYNHHTMKIAMGTTIALAALLVASCSLPGSPKQVAAANPSVTYKYTNDDQLIEANQRAITYCNQFDSFPRSQSFSKAADGSNIVIFECVNSSLATASTNQPNSGLTYNYRTDQELVDASRNAQTYCVNHGSPEMESTIVANSNGSKTVTFRCNAS
jgi:PBP1b-binding outer membrane lipoprotein LpoB